MQEAVEPIQKITVSLRAVSLRGGRSVPDKAISQSIRLNPSDPIGIP
jgi:hypothetical protein